MTYPNPKIKAMQEIADRFPNSYEAVAFLKEEREVFGGKNASQIILDGQEKKLYAFFDSQDLGEE